MKLVSVLAAPGDADLLCRALADAGFVDLVATEARLPCTAPGMQESYRGVRPPLTLLTRTRIEVVVPDAQAEAAARLLQASGRISRLLVYRLDDPATSRWAPPLTAVA